MTPDEKLAIIETYGKCSVETRPRPVAETVTLFEYTISVDSSGDNTLWRTGETHTNAVDRMYMYLQLIMAAEIKMV
jgi:hypothetical protein